MSGFPRYGQYIFYLEPNVPKGNKKGTVTSIKKQCKLYGEVGMAVQISVRTRIVGISYILHDFHGIVKCNL